MNDQSPSIAEVDEFIDRWGASGASERANYALFLAQLCKLLGVPEPDPSTPDDEHNAYVFDRSVPFTEPDGTTTTGFIDLYKRGAFILEAKQGSDRETDAEREAAKLRAKPKRKKKGTAVRGTKGWDDAMVRARGQADAYARALPLSEGWPPFLVVVDVGHCIELYSEFSRSGKSYLPFPDPRAFRIKLIELRNDDIRDRLRLVWSDPLSLDPSQQAAKVTRELAQRLAELAKLLEKTGHDAARVARFLMRCLFTMFAEDVELIPKDSFKNLLKQLKGNPAAFQPMVAELWRAMNEGTFSTALRAKLRLFNGGLFADNEALPLNGEMLDLLHDAASSHWAAVEPAIFGTLLERALDPNERHKLGAHFTPRAYVERLVMPTIIEPLREDWKAVYAAAVTIARGGDLLGAQTMVRRFHETLCDTRILDPACGSGNFLYVTLEHLKRLEGEVLNALHDFGDQQKVLLEVDPHQFLGIEINPRAAAIAELVLWIGYLQWHFRSRGKDIAEPIIKNYHNIECRDAVLRWDVLEPLLDGAGEAVTRWDGTTTKKHPVTGDDVPDETAVISALSYVNVCQATWPKANYVVGNPPYIGVRKLRATVGPEYVDALAKAYPELPETADFVMYWWHKAAQLIECESLRRFGFITTDSIVQQYSRPALDLHLNANPGVQIIFAIDEHPWVEDRDGAAVQVAMTVAAHSINYNGPKRLGRVIGGAGRDEVEVIVEPVSSIGSLLRADLDMRLVKPLISNANLCFQGLIPGNDGFKLTTSEFSELGITQGRLPAIVRRYVIGKDLVRQHQEKFVIDCFGLTEAEVAEKHPKFYQWLMDRVKPERDHNPRETRRQKWWLFAENAPKLRRSLVGLKRYIATPYTAKYRPFVFLDGDILPDAMAYAVASDDAFILGILNARPHQVWALQTGGTLEDRPRYNSRETFLPFPFPVVSENEAKAIREIAERLDAHRKGQLAIYPKLKLTDVYNVLARLRSGEALTSKEKITHEQGLVSVVRQIHDDLDAAVCKAYGWSRSVTDEEILQRLVSLNSERSAEETRGRVHWLRPDLQNLGDAPVVSPDTSDINDSDFEEMPLSIPNQRKKPLKSTPFNETKKRKAQKTKQQAWPQAMDAQAKAVLVALREYEGSATAEELATCFKRASRDRIAELLQTLSTLGQARRRGDRYFA